MNFTSEIRRELMKSVPAKRCCKTSLLAAFIETSGYLTLGRVGIRDEISFTSEHEEVAEYILALAESLFGVRFWVDAVRRDPKQGRYKLTFSYALPGAGEIAEEISAHFAGALSSPCCYAAYLKGAFLGSGSCTLPSAGGKTGYHLEFVFGEQSEAESFSDLLDELQLLGSVAARGDKYLVYCKSRETICDVLSVLEAPAALGRLERLVAAREETNLENRIENCMAGNADRSATASVAQVLALGKLRESGVLAALPAALVQTAEGRLGHPELSLTELAEELGVTKSCLNHRMRRLMKLYAEKFERN